MTHNGAIEWFRSQRPVPRWIFASSLLAVALLGFFDEARVAQTAELAITSGYAQSPTAQCVLRLALATTNKISGVYPRAEALVRISEAQLEAGEFG